MRQRRYGGAGPLVGRRAECAVLDRAIKAARDGESRVLVLHGAPGVGKSALLGHAERQADGLRVLRGAGVESEMELPYATLHQLCAPLLGDGCARRLPSLQREALETVFGLRAGEPPERFLVGLAVLTLLSEAGGERPLLCLIDDAHWMDQASARVVGFVARRLLAEPVALLFGARQRGPVLSGLPDLEVEGLRDADSHALLETVTRFGLDQHIRDRIVAETRGNPLALLELPRGLSRTEMAGGFGLLTAEALPRRIEASFLGRVAALPAPTRSLLLIAAAEPVGDPVLLWRAAERLGVAVGSALIEGTDGLLTIEERVTFRHPLVRSAVYQAAGVDDRRSVHLALAEVTDAATDPDRRAWHLAAAAAGPDEAVAAELERSAERAQARGGLAAAAALLQRAVALTTDLTRRADRAVTAAGATLQAGDLEAARRYAGIAEREARSEFQRAKAHLVRSQIAFAAGLNQEAPPLLLAAARRLEPFDMDLAREIYLYAWGAASLLAADADSLMAVSQAIKALPPRDGEPGVLDLVLRGCALLVTDGREAAVPVLQRALPGLLELPAADVLKWGWVANGVSSAVWDDRAMRAIYRRSADVIRAVGALAELPFCLSSLGTATTWTGDFADSAAIAAEADTVAAATGVPLAPYVRLRMTALQGRKDEALELIDATVREAGASGQLMGVTVAQWAAAVLHNGLGDYEKAAASARASTEIAELWVSVWALPELIEAAARTGDEKQARAALDRLTEAAAPCDTDWAQGVLSRSRALLDGGDELHLEAIDRLSRTPLRPELARAHLVYGEWLRREQRGAEARDNLTTAYEMFQAIGMEAFAERARRELLGAGTSVRRQRADAPAGDDLTPQERQIAMLVRDGFSNPEIGTRLFLSPRTVEWHLRKVFAKLGVASRRQLRDAIPRTETEVPA
ncbi:ATP-binding protein [Paractinoplanes atraurantiacus]|uniref:ATP-, maltotriose- and DNA-dependent transcriptional regulator MalT n=1 Tax=Paractinoplanes atraurantiacus TaxID=1036182 RepID=A0A285JQZ3_9ACTN|nr:LuxR family transcriptional regulator [Actinoplanes atraurantiacus]SNY62734.1 ATP-, maltotriose- and DNA-dependent transcriptional regulator MalT [Actinoplanes atraurantiacus]